MRRILGEFSLRGGGAGAVLCFCALQAPGFLRGLPGPTPQQRNGSRGEDGYPSKSARPPACLRQDGGWVDTVWSGEWERRAMRASGHVARLRRSAPSNHPSNHPCRSAVPFTQRSPAKPRGKKAGATTTTPPLRGTPPWEGNLKRGLRRFPSFGGVAGEAGRGGLAHAARPLGRRVQGPRKAPVNSGPQANKPPAAGQENLTGKKPRSAG